MRAEYDYNPALQNLQCLILGLTDLMLKMSRIKKKNYKNDNSVLCLPQEEFIVLVGPSKIQIKHNWVKNPNWLGQTSWLFMSV